MHASPHTVVRRPPYTPTVSPIESAFAWIKKFLRKHCHVLTPQNLETWVGRAVETLPPTALNNFYRNCGY